MSGAIATAGAVAAASSAGAAAASARRSECYAMMPSYMHEGATLAEMREYASCIRIIHGDGEPLSSGLVLFFKAAIVFSLASSIFGALYGWKEEGVFFSAIMALIGLICGAIIPFLGLIVFEAIKFVIS